MQLARLELSGFKSFARHTALQFGEGLTAVIGPNGSGKSNLAEAIKWVLGEQSLKQLRGQKSDDVIYAGHGTRKGARSATVSLTLTNESGRFPHPASELSFSRTLNRQHEGQYLLNGDTVRLFDLQHMLAHAGIGTKSYTVIHQGMINRYLEATPGGRRELFDEATGIRALQLKVSRAQRQLQQTRDKAHELMTILQELQPRLTVLERQVARHQKRQDTEQEFVAVQTQWLHNSWHAQARAEQHAQALVEQLYDRIATARAAREQVEQHLLHALDGTARSETTELHDQLREAHVAYERALNDHARARAEKEHLDTLVHEARTARERAERVLNTAREQLAHDGWISDVRTALQRSQELLDDLEAGTVPPAYRVHALRDAVRQATAHLRDDQTAVAAAQSLLAQLEQPLTQLARWQALEHERLQRYEALVVPPEPDRHHLERLESHLARSHPSSSSDASAYQAALDEARLEEIAAEREGSAAQAALEQARTAVQRLETEVLRERGSEFLHTIRHTAPEQPVPDDDLSVLEERLRRLSATLSSLGEGDPLALTEYAEVRDRVDHLQSQLHDIEHAEQNIVRLIQTVQHEMRERFTAQFHALNDAFAAYFRSLFGDGKAELVLVPREGGTAGEVLTEGIDIVVQPPGKRARHLQLLSGGEKTLTSLALLFAILDVQQPPFIVLDEVDAALDEANSYRFAQLLKEKSATTQCIVITHNRETMAQADVLYGVTMDQQGVSHVYSVKLEDVTETMGERAELHV